MNIDITLERVCSGGGHATLGVVVDGGAKKMVSFEVEDLRGAIDDKEQFIEGIIRLSLSGLTKLQARNKLQAGISITIP